MTPSPSLVTFVSPLDKDVHTGDYNSAIEFIPRVLADDVWEQSSAIGMDFKQDSFDSSIVSSISLDINSPLASRTELRTIKKYNNQSEDCSSTNWTYLHCYDSLTNPIQECEEC